MVIHPLYYLTPIGSDDWLQAFFTSDVSTSAFFSYLCTSHARIHGLLEVVDADAEPTTTRALNSWMLHAPYMKAKHRLLIKAQRQPQIIGVKRLLQMFPHIYRHLEPLLETDSVIVSTYTSVGEPTVFINMVEGDTL